MTDPALGSNGQEREASWSASFERATKSIAIELAQAALRSHDQPESQLPNVEGLARLLQRVADHVDDIDVIPTEDFLALTLDAMITAGGGVAFKLTDELLSATNRIINDLIGRGRHTSDHLLALARYYSGFSNGGDIRRQTIMNAITQSITIDERVRSLLTLARLEIDCSNYAAARRIVAECDEVAAPELRQLRADILVTTGMSYYYSEPTEAEKYFRLTLELDAPSSPGRHVGYQQPTAEAHHYLGRLAKERGRYQEALDRLVVSQSLAWDSLTGRGFFHLRIAEILLDHGPPIEANYHLRESRSCFEQGQQFSTGEAQLDAAEARHFARMGDVVRAVQLLKPAIARSRLDKFPRGELICLALLFKIQLKRGHLFSASGCLLRGAAVYFASEIEQGLGHFLRQIRMGVRQATTLLVSPKPSAEPDVRCPCGATHEVPSLP
jgi:tetratricopeptide (TPR) repeat protein